MSLSDRQFTTRGSRSHNVVDTYADFLAVLKAALDDNEVESTLRRIADEKKAVQKLKDDYKKERSENERLYVELNDLEEKNEKLAETNKKAAENNRQEAKRLENAKNEIDGEKRELAAKKKEFLAYEEKTRSELKSLGQEAEKAIKTAKETQDKANKLKVELEGKIADLKKITG